MWEIVPHSLSGHKENVMTAAQWTRRLNAALAVAVLVVAGCGGGGGGADNGNGSTGGGGTPPPPPPVESAGHVLPASKPGDLVAFVQDRLRARQARQSASPGTEFVVSAAATPSAAVVTSVGPEHSNTTVQEPGVDEDDLIKSDGTFIYTLDRDAAPEPGQGPTRLKVHRRRPDGGLELLRALRPPPPVEGTVAVHGMHYAPSAARLALLGDQFVGPPIEPCPPGAFCIAAGLLPPVPTRPNLLIDLVDVADPAQSALAGRIRIEGRLVGSRLIGNALYVVTQHLPQLAVEALPVDTPSAVREAEIAKLRAADLLPTISINGGAPQPLMAETDCTLQPKNASLGIEITSITAFDLGSATLQRASRCFVGGSEALYMSTASLYLATTRYDVALASDGRLIYPPQITTDIHKFALDGLAIDYKGSGNVQGHLGWDVAKKSYRMGEHHGDLRVLSFTGSQGWLAASDAQRKPASPATLTVLRERAGDSSLQVIATLPNAKRPQALGLAGEQIYAVRFAGPRGYLVTFRQIDPLYILDLADPADPGAVGELKMPGYSDHLFPFGEGLLLGVGRDASAEGRIGGVKLGLFDVADPALPRALDFLTVGDQGTYSALDSSAHGVNIFVRGGVARVGLPMASFGFTPGSVKHGLQRFEVDLSGRSLRSLSMIQAPDPAATPDLWSERSVQVESQVYYLTQGTLIGRDW